MSDYINNYIGLALCRMDDGSVKLYQAPRSYVDRLYAGDEVMVQGSGGLMEATVMGYAVTKYGSDEYMLFMVATGTKTNEPLPRVLTRIKHVDLAYDDDELGLTREG